LLVLSGKDSPGLTRVIDQFESFLRSDIDAEFSDICFSAATGRRHFDHRVAVVAANKADAAAVLREQKETATRAETTFTKNPKVAFWFSGSNEGASEALSQLVRRQPIVEQFIADVDQRLSQFVQSDDWKKIAGESKFDSDTIDSDVAAFKLQASLVKLWQHWGLEPESVAGAGIGQYLAACAAGGLCFLDAVTLVAARESVLKRKTTGATDDETNQMLDAFEAYADTLNFYPPNRALICSVDGNEVPIYKSLGGSYWRDHCLDRGGKDDIDKALAALGETGNHVILCVSPTSPADGEPSELLASGATILRSDCDLENVHNGLLERAAALYSGGVKLTIGNMFEGQCHNKVGLPAYPFDKKRYWITEIAQHARPAKNENKTND
jgi:acyl transferase domain-containing protein